MSAVFIRIDLISAGERLDKPAAAARRSRHHRCCTRGAAERRLAVPVPTTADTEAPGAAISGLIRLKLTSGPREEVSVDAADERSRCSSGCWRRRDGDLGSERPFSVLAVACVTTSEGLQVPSGVTGHWPPLRKVTACSASTSPTMTADRASRAQPRDLLADIACAAIDQRNLSRRIRQQRDPGCRSPSP